MEQWLIEPPHNLLQTEQILFENGRTEYTKLNFLWKENNVYVMDNHLAAGWCWLQACSMDEHYSFLHIDQHTDDALQIFTPSDYDSLLNRLPSFSIEDYCNEHIMDNGVRCQTFQCESYIRPIAKLYPQWFDKKLFAVHKPQSFHSHPNDELPNIMQINRRQLIDYIESLLESDTKWIVNLDLDYLYLDNRQILPSCCLEKIGEAISLVRGKIQVLTIALSTPWCEGLENSLSLLGILSKHVPELKHFSLNRYL